MLYARIKDIYVCFVLFVYILYTDLVSFYFYILLYSNREHQNGLTGFVKLSLNTDVRPCLLLLV